MAYLYISSSGKPWRKHSYSAGNTFDQCPMKYYLQKIEGWKEKDNKAAFMFGRAVENAIQWYHEHDGNKQSTLNVFIEEWAKQAANTELRYTAVEKDWASLYKAGLEMLKLYFIKQPSLPIPLGGQTLFQKEAKKEVFPNDPNYGEIEDAGKLDIIAYVDPNHPMLPKLDWKAEFGPLRPVIIDIKTSGVDFPEAYGIAAYDTQLRRYSWLSGIRDVALLWFVKKSHNSQKGSSVTLLEDTRTLAAGQEAIVAQIDDNDNLVLVANESMIEMMEKAQGRKEDGKLDTTKAAKQRRDEWLSQYAEIVAPAVVTKQRLQFNAGYVSEQSANDAGEIAARQIINIVNAWQRRAYPNTFGIRFPHDDKNDPFFIAFVLGDEKYKELNFTKSNEESLDDLFGDEGEPNG